MTDIEDILGDTPNYRTLHKNLNADCIEFVNSLASKTFTNAHEYHQYYTELRRQYHVSPSKPELNIIYEGLMRRNIIKENHTLKKFMRGKEMRSLSGVVVISILTSPYPTYTNKNGETKKQKFSCKHDCFYCPRETDDDGKEVNPRSYLSDEPAVARALQNDYDAVDQFNDRAYQYVINNHEVDKIELIILGGTWTEYPPEYQEMYIRDCFWAANTFYDIEKRPKQSLQEEQTINENQTKCRIIGITLEMRPDSINIDEIKRLRYLGCTRVQLGVQHTNDRILRNINRGCYFMDTVRALKLLKDNCYKVDAHWMPDLPLSSPEIDKEMFDLILTSDLLQFDQWKIYPTATVPWTKIKKWYDEGNYIPYTEKNPDDLIDLLLYVKKRVHPWIRLNRVIRDIPNYTRDGKLYIYAGNKVTNLRQILHNELKKKGEFCPCIRCREVKKKDKYRSHAQIIVRKYESSGGEEYFISMESGNSATSYYQNDHWYDDTGKIEPGIMYGFVRLRLSNQSDLPCLQDAALVRELHVYGQVATCNKNNGDQCIEVQHKGFGTQLMKKAEEIAHRHHYYRIAVISGVGVRNYYRKLGYDLCDTFMIKEMPTYFKIQNEINIVYEKIDTDFLRYLLFIFMAGICNVMFGNNNKRVISIKPSIK